jgi:HK97 family phage major capsid protein
MRVIPRDFINLQKRLLRATVLGQRHRLETRKEPTIADLNAVIEQLATGFEALKKKNDERLIQLETRGTADAVTVDEFKKIQAEVLELREQKKEIEELRLKMGRPGGRGRQPGEMTAEQREHRTAFLGLLRNPSSMEHRARLQKAEMLAIKAEQAEEFETRATATTTDAAGGYAVPEMISRTIEAELLEISPLRQLVTVVQAGSKDYKQLVDVRGTAYGWVGETGSRTATAEPTLAEVAPTFGTLYAFPSATEESLSDMFFNVESWLSNSAIEAFGAGEENAIILGNGTNKPTGFLNGTPAATVDGVRAFGTLQFVATGQAATWKATTPLDTFQSLIYQLKKGYRANARWLMNKATAGEVMLFKDSQNNYQWQPSVIEGQPDRLLGYPVAESEEMPDKAANAFPVAFGDFKAGYLLCDLVGLRMTRDEITTPGYVKWYIRRRLGGKVMKSEAIKLIKVSI